MKKVFLYTLSFVAFAFVGPECKSSAALGELGDCPNQCINEFKATCQHLISMRKQTKEPLSIKACSEMPINTLKKCLQAC
jgi:hypothetical protein